MYSVKDGSVEFFREDGQPLELPESGAAPAQLASGPAS